MKRTARTFYTIHVSRDGEKPVTGARLIQYNAERYPSLADARVAARRLNEYVEIRRVREITESTLAERVEA